MDWTFPPSLEHVIDLSYENKKGKTIVKYFSEKYINLETEFIWLFKMIVKNRLLAWNNGEDKNCINFWNNFSV